MESHFPHGAMSKTVRNREKGPTGEGAKNVIDSFGGSLLEESGKKKAERNRRQGRENFPAVATGGSRRSGVPH